MYAGKADVGMELARQIYENIVLRQRHPFDLPNILRGDTGARIFGTDYYQMMILWALPAALEGQDLAGLCKPDGLVQRMIQASKRDN